MVAKIISGKSIKGALNYNENKVSKNKATLIGENNFQKDAKHLTFHEKLFRLQDLASRNVRVKTNTVHISLNFASGETLAKEKLNAIASDYMKGIGFARQPYLVYQHSDTGHPHIHIVTTNIQSNGERISLHNLGRTKSEETRKEIEQKYDLVPAESKKQAIDITRVSKVEYGSCETKSAIGNVVKAIISEYKFTSIAEFNMVLKNYNVVADRGAKGSIMYKKQGMLYWALDKNETKVGVPIKASALVGKPTLKKLEKVFEANKESRKPFKNQLKSKLDEILLTKATQSGFERSLANKHIEVAFRQNDTGKLYGVTFVDHNTKTVFKGSDLGKAYSANTLEAYFLKNAQGFDKGTKAELEKTELSELLSQDPKPSLHTSTPLIVSLLETEFDDGTTFQSLKQKHNKKRRKGQTQKQ
jgi:hypothetical protein